jgi:hypothetical protein
VIEKSSGDVIHVIIQPSSTMNNLRNNEFRNGTEKPGKQELILPDPCSVGWISDGGAVRTRDEKGRRRKRAIKKAKKIMSSSMRKNEKFPG